MNKNTSVEIARSVQKNIDWNTPENKQFVSAILSLESSKETEAFLRDLMTEGEITEFGKRLEAARLLSADMQYNFITQKTGLSSATVARISKWLKGSLGGYRLVLSRLSNGHHSNPAKLGKGLSLSR
ncbi:MAG: DNA-binding transcriptional regulator [Candidatus Pacebacteria bacterium]|nr:DNA-binding transcriptional regulator [Candidatus Paceibacterota bacterium]MBP9851249.1 DNA-binding transcriptional regulator [Candidatus Paceibacterota bacterium]